jgi:hypothetical protein
MKPEASVVGVIAEASVFLLVAALTVGPISAQQVTGTLGSADTMTMVDGRPLSTPAPKFGGVLKQSAKDSTSSWPPRVVPSAIAGKTIFTYTGENSRIPTGGAPSILDKNYTITAEVTIPEGGGEGMIATLGGRFGGYALFLSQSNNWWLRSTALTVEIWGLLLLGLFFAWLARNRRWTGWKTWPGNALLFLTPVWLVAGLMAGAAQTGRGRPIFVYNMLDLERFCLAKP